MEVSTKPYLIRAIYDWCTDSGFTPYLAVAVDETVRVPFEFVKNGEIVLNVSALATNRLKIGNDAVEFQARFGGVPREVHIPIARVIAVYARENGQGMAFDVPRALTPAGVEPATGGASAGVPRTLEMPRGAGALVPVSPSDQSNGDREPPPPGPAKPGERPRLTRIK
ncbi:MAG TPA: ClpXP protease specificity-enhancing factor [Burkholderiaceae bacterium]|nr:ClpXP protease specificity-enhancing factor [Burkholderiaceae bacterium]